MRQYITIIILSLTVAGCGYNSMFHSPPKPRVEIPVTYNIGWWSYQDDLSVDSLGVQIIDSQLNLFNSESLISYSISGKIKYRGPWYPKIEEVHISERLNSDTTQLFDRIIEITPIVEVKDNKSKGEGVVEFRFTNQHKIISGHWGINRIKFICGSKEKLIELRQAK